MLLPRNRSLSFAGGPLVMGVVNVTPDSFSDGGAHFDRKQAIEAALRMEASGASILDVGGESTRPGAEPVAPEDEIDRVIPVIEGIRRRSDVAISVDTMKSAVALAAAEAGADILNDVTALRFDPAMAVVARDHHLPVILMHMKGEPRTMQQHVHYDDLIGEIRASLEDARDRAIEAGVDPESILVDPGIGFGKTFEHNLEILGRLESFASLAPLVVGASRKAFVGHLTGKPAGPARMAGSLAPLAAAARAGAAIVRVHDVAETVDFLKVLGAIGRYVGSR